MSTLTVRRLATECRVPRTLGHVAAAADAVARGRLRGDVGARLGPTLDQSGEIVRIRRLPVRVAMPAAVFDERTLAEAWTSAFVRSLFQAMACPAGSVAPFAVARYPSRAAQLAALVRDALSGVAAQRWEYAEFRASGAADDPRQVFALCTSTAETRELLAALDDALDPLLQRLDDLALERLIQRLATDAEPHAITLDDVLAAIALAAQFQSASSRPKRADATHATQLRRLALLLVAHAARHGDAAGAAAARAPRVLLHALIAAAVLAETPAAALQSGAPVERIAARFLPPPVADFLRSLRRDGVPAVLQTAIATFAEAILPPQIAAAASRGETPAPWIASPNAAIFLLAPFVQRLGWPALRRDPAVGERGFELLLIAVARAVIAMARRVEDEDPAPALFGGCLGTPDRLALRDAEQDETIPARAGELVAALRACIRGFRQAPLAAIVRQFVARPGRIRIDDRRVTVVLDSSPFHVALHVSGADDGAASLEWLGGRALEIALEGL